MGIGKSILKGTGKVVVTVGKASFNAVKYIGGELIKEAQRKNNQYTTYKNDFKNEDKYSMKDLEKIARNKDMSFEKRAAAVDTAKARQEKNQKKS